MNNHYKFWGISMSLAFAIGICIGSVASANGDSHALFSAAAGSLSSPSLMHDSFLRALRTNLGTVLLLFVFGTSFLGGAPSLVLLSLRGYSIGQTVGALVSAFGFRGFGAAACGIFPHNLFYIPFFCLLAVLGTGFAGRLFRQSSRGKEQFLSYTFTSLMVTIPILLGCLVEGYVSAPLLRRILGPMLS